MDNPSPNEGPLPHDRPSSHEGPFPHEGRVIRDDIRIDASPEDIWRAWVDPECVPQWFVERAKGEMEVGKTFEWLWDEAGEAAVNHVLSVEPPRRLLLRHDLPEGPTYLEITIEQEDGQSILRLVQSGFGDGRLWDEQYDGMASGWMLALAVLKIFAERYLNRQRTEIMVLRESPFDREGLLTLQRTQDGLGRWLTSKADIGTKVGEPVTVVFQNGHTLTGRVLRQTPYETSWSWEEIDGILEFKAFRGEHWGSQVGVRVMSWLEDTSALDGLHPWLKQAVETLVDVIG